MKDLFQDESQNYDMLPPTVVYFRQTGAILNRKICKLL